MNFQKKLESNITSNFQTPDLDFNPLINSTQPLDYIIKVLIIQKRENVHYALDVYMKAKSLGQTPDLSMLRGHLLNLFFGLKATLKNHYTILKEVQTFESLESDILSAKSFEALYKVASALEDFLYLKGVIKFDIIKNLSGSDLEGHNRSHGYI